MKTNKLLLSIPFLLIPLTGCITTGGKTLDKEAFDDTREDYYQNIEKRNAFDKECDLNFDDEITNGLDDSVWNTLDGYWENGGTTPHNGVRRRNIFYTKDSNNNGYVALKARGLYNLEDPVNAGKPEGACIETKKSLGPGRYEVYMASMPREGGVTALWTYKCETGNENTSQNEIDIEIGGGGQYSKLWCTTWTKKTNKATQSPDVSNICYMNDGRIHKYTFDWYTEYGETGQGRIDWFVDEHFVQSISGGTVTDIDMPLWLGVWMPSWAGNATWVEDYILVDRVKYTAFDDGQYYEEKRAYTTYAPLDPSKSNIQSIDFTSITSGLNKLSNPSFELTNAFAENDYYGWNKFTPNKYTNSIVFTENCSDGDKALKITCGNAEQNNDGYYYQRISCSYEGFRYRFSIDAKLADVGSDAEIILWQRNVAGLGTIDKATLPITSTTFQRIEANVQMLAGSGTLDVFLHVKRGSAIFDNAKLFTVVQ